MSNLLDRINSPADLKELSQEQILQLNEEIRSFLIENVTQSGGHLASNLGVVELTVALHRVFNSPCDRIIWDVGHQSYVHKILTGRKESFATLRAQDGLSGFTKRSESEHDPFGAGHSSTSVSAALGFAAADKLLLRDAYTVAVVGDGSFTGGMIYEAVNNCPADSKLIIVLNENEMSISKNVGNFAKHISKIRSTKKYLKMKSVVIRIVEKIPFCGDNIARFLSRLKDTLKAAVYRTNFFEQFGLHYIGPINGNDYSSLELFLNEAKKRNESCIVHIKTEKGCGFEDAKNNPEKYHSVPRKSDEKSTYQSSFSQICAKTLCSLAEKDDKICAITAAMEGGTGLSEFRKRFPERFFDVGIAEEHAVVFCAGLSAGGMHPVFYIYSSFLQRAYDELLHDISLQKLGITLCVDRAGFATDDGATHHGVFDVAFLSHINGCEIFAPVCEKTLSNMLTYCTAGNKISAIRYPKGYENSEVTDVFYRSEEDFKNFDIKLAFDKAGSFEGKKYIIITYGNLVCEALKCAKELNKDADECGIILLETLKPLGRQAELIINALPEHSAKIVFAEEGIKCGGVGVQLLEELSRCSKMNNKSYSVLAIEDELPETGTLSYLYEKCKLSANCIKSELLKDKI